MGNPVVPKFDKNRRGDVPEDNFDDQSVTFGGICEGSCFTVVFCWCRGSKNVILRGPNPLKSLFV